ncbi:gamma-glutamyltransferase [Alteribacillus sp. JSM 102045]|uniref:gamma-glutamyltransferase n=1 Tax=Alteribacillus sp. JSM 102045 TaxID=1562101 RepID=UPI0035BFE8C4
MGSKKDSIFVLILLSIAAVLLSTQTTPNTPINPDPDYESQETIDINKDGKNPGIGVATDNPYATEVGMEVLKRGGNAVDAAIAISYSLSVLEPYASGIGGGGLMLVHPADGTKPVLYDYRETAPDNEDKPEAGIGVPGFVAGMDKAHNDFGTRSMKVLLEPSINQAKNGIRVSSMLHLRLNNANYRIPPTEASLFYPNNKAIEEGRKLKQEELAETITDISENGPDVFYKGKIGEELADKVDGIETEDLEDYEVEKTEPIKGEFAGFYVYTPPPPSGGTMLIQSLQMAEHLQVSNLKENPSEFIQANGEINREAYKDRLETIGDPKYVDMSVDELTSKEYAENLASDVSLNALNDEKLVDTEPEKDGNTTHFVVVDQDGMMVSATNTLSNFFGSGFFTNGFFLNNQLENFSSSSNSPNSYEPGKRPFSYITPTVLAKNDIPLIGIGSAGGRRIVPTLSQVLTRHLLFKQPIHEAIDENRSHRDMHNKKIYLEGRITNKIKEELEDAGYTVDNTKAPLYFGSVQSLTVDYNKEKIYGGSDHRRNGKWMSR